MLKKICFFTFLLLLSFTLSQSYAGEAAGPTTEDPASTAPAPGFCICDVESRTWECGTRGDPNTGDQCMPLPPREAAQKVVGGDNCACKKSKWNCNNSGHHMHKTKCRFKE